MFVKDAMIHNEKGNRVFVLYIFSVYLFSDTKHKEENGQNLGISEF